jgi:hypothetical protein
MVCDTRKGCALYMDERNLVVFVNILTFTDLEFNMGETYRSGCSERVQVFSIPKDFFTAVLLRQQLACHVRRHVNHLQSMNQRFAA